ARLDLSFVTPLPSRPLLLYLYSPCPHRDLLSFPTRRSSDLRVLALPLASLPRRPSVSRGTTGTPVPSMAIYRIGTGGTRGVTLRSEEQRLNSSHVSISYAVFCLKKKNSLNTHMFHCSISRQR